METLRIFTEVGLEADISGQLYATGKEKQEVAQEKCRALPTVVAQITELFSKLGIKNRSELTMEYARRLNSMGITLDYKPQVRSFIAGGLLCASLISISFNIDFNMICRRSRRNEYASIEVVERCDLQVAA